MNKSTRNLLLLGAGALALYFLTRKKPEVESGGGGGGGVEYPLSPTAQSVGEPLRIVFEQTPSAPYSSGTANNQTQEQKATVATLQGAQQVLSNYIVTQSYGTGAVGVNPATSIVAAVNQQGFPVTFAPPSIAKPTVTLAAATKFAQSTGEFRPVSSPTVTVASLSKVLGRSI